VLPTAVPAKFWFGTLAPLTVTALFTGEKVYDALEGVTVYEPLFSPVNW
jgi:hypothetical protein